MTSRKACWVDEDFTSRVSGLNADALSATIDRARLDAAIRAQGVAFHQAITAEHANLFAEVPLFVTASQINQMHTVVAAVERIVKLPEWMNSVQERQDCLGVFYGYDFHLNEQGAHLIEINTNAGGAFLNALLLESQRNVALPGEVVASKDPERDILRMFLNEWRLMHGDKPLNSVAIVDEQPETQYLFPEFLLAKAMFDREGIPAYIADPSSLEARNDGLYLDGIRIDLVYNRLTDFSLHKHHALREAYLHGLAVVTPSPAHHARYADKRNLVKLSDGEGLRTLGATEADIAALKSGVPRTIEVRPDLEATLWSERKQWFFKPNSGFGSKGAYRGEKLTKRVFGEIMQSDYVAQKLALPGERSVSLEEGQTILLKYDVRCYVYEGQVQLVVARLYQGQTTNFRTKGGGFSMVRSVG